MLPPLSDRNTVQTSDHVAIWYEDIFAIEARLGVKVLDELGEANIEYTDSDLLTHAITVDKDTYRLIYEYFKSDQYAGIKLSDYLNRINGKSNI